MVRSTWVWLIVSVRGAVGAKARKVVWSQAVARRINIILYALSYSRFQVTGHTKGRLERGELGDRDITKK